MKELICKSTATGLDYLLYLPDEYDKNPAIDHSLLVFPHGGGESGTDIEPLRNFGVPKYIRNGAELPCVVLCPLHPEPRQFWDDALVYKLVEEIVMTYRIDKTQIHLMGASRGGYAVWRLAINHPDTWASLVVAAGSSAPYGYAKWMGSAPVWVFHGTADQTVAFEISERMVNALKAQDIPVKFTVMPGRGHDIWDDVFSNAEVYEWMFAQRR